MGLREMDSALPPGFRFYPSDEELVCFYLRHKVANQRVASGTLIEVDLHAREPWDLPGKRSPLISFLYGPAGLLSHLLFLFSFLAYDNTGLHFPLSKI